MICQTCAAAADICDAPALPGASFTLATNWHAGCAHGPPGCACQHRIPTVEQMRERRADRRRTRPEETR